MALSARITEVGAKRGIGQGSLAGDRQNLHALIKVLGPTLFGYLFGLGCQIGVPALPFLFAAATSSVAALLIALTPGPFWQSKKLGKKAAAETLPPPPRLGGDTERSKTS